jgi:uncharacterized protein YkwD
LGGFGLCRRGSVVWWLRWGAAVGLMAVASVAAGAPRNGQSLGLSVLGQINWVRAHPADYADRLREVPQSAATREAIAYLERRDPAPPLEVSPGLGVSAAMHAADQSRHGAFEHTGSDGSSAGERTHRAGVWAGMMAEEMAAGQETSEDIVRALIVDEGVPDRGHRNDLMDPLLRRAGVGCASHPVYGVICVIDLASAATPRD